MDRRKGIQAFTKAVNDHKLFKEYLSAYQFDEKIVLEI